MHMRNRINQMSSTIAQEQQSITTLITERKETRNSERTQRKPIPCKYYMKGLCEFGSRCRYQHAESQTTRTTQIQNQNADVHQETHRQRPTQDTNRRHQRRRGGANQRDWLKSSRGRKRGEKPVSILYSNPRGIRSKTHSLQAALEANKPDILVLVETQLMRRHDLTNKKTMTMTMTMTKTFGEHPQIATPETFDLWDIWSEWWGDMTWQTKRQWQRQWQWQWQLENTLK